MVPLAELAQNDSAAATIGFAHSGVDDRSDGPTAALDMKHEQRTWRGTGGRVGLGGVNRVRQECR